MKVDFETIIFDVEIFLKANLNTKITEINTEKADGITLSPVSSSAYRVLTLNDEIANVNPFIFISAESPDVISVSGANSKTLNIPVVLVLVDDGNSVTIPRQLLRYQRALIEIFEEGFDKISCGWNFEMNSLDTIAFKLINDSNNYKAVGVELTLQFV